MHIVAYSFISSIFMCKLLKWVNKSFCLSIYWYIWSLSVLALLLPPSFLSISFFPTSLSLLSLLILPLFSSSFSSLFSLLPSPSFLPSFFFNLFFNWRIIALQNFVVFCQTSTWISHKCTYVPSLLNLPSISLPIPPL